MGVGVRGVKLFVCEVGGEKRGVDVICAVPDMGMRNGWRRNDGSGWSRSWLYLYLLRVCCGYVGKELRFGSY